MINDKLEKDPFLPEPEIVSKSYPAAPWNLKGHLYGSIWSLPPQDIKVKLPPEFSLLVNFGRASAFAGFVDYQKGSTLVYHELIGGVVVKLRDKLSFAFNVTHIWVDDESSKLGGREIWGVPKELANFKYEYPSTKHDFQASCEDNNTGKLLASGSFQPIVGFPRWARLPVPFPNLQILHDQPHRSSGTFWSALQICRGGTLISLDSPLADLGIAGRKPLVSFAGLDFKMHLEAARPVTRK